MKNIEIIAKVVYQPETFRLMIVSDLGRRKILNQIPPEWGNYLVKREGWKYIKKVSYWKCSRSWGARSSLPR